MKIIEKLVLFFMVVVIVLQLSEIDAVAKGYNTPYPRLSEIYFLDIKSYPYEKATDYDVGTIYEKLPYSSSLGMVDRKVKAKYKHHRGMLRVRYQQRGYTSTCTIKIDGKRLSREHDYDNETAYIPESGRFGAVAWKTEAFAINVDDTVEESEIKIVASFQDDNGIHTYTQTLTIEWIDDGGPAPTSVRFRYDPELNKSILENVDSTMEYRLKGSSNNDWKPCTDAPMEFPVTTATYHVRYAATDTEPASKATTVTLVGKRAAPSCIYNNTTEELSGLTDKMEISFSDGDYRPVPSGTTSMSMSEYIDELADDETLTVSVRYPLESFAPESNAFTKVIYPRLAEPDLTYDTAALTLSGVDAGMSYRLSNAVTWTSIYGTVLNLEQFSSAEKDVTVLVRYRPTSTNSASHEKAFTIAKLLDGPTGTVNYASETISGFDDDVAYQYKFGNPTPGESGWNDVVIENGSFDISKLISSSSRTINIRKAKTAVAPITNHTAFNIPKRLSSPSSPTFTYNNANYYGKAVLSGVTPEMEYKNQNDSSWTSVGNDDIVVDIPDVNNTYYVRYKATSENFASSNKTALLRRISSAPSPSYNTTTETLTNLTSTMEISYNGSEYIPVEKGISSLNLSERITELTDVLTINVRYSATATAPASDAKTITIYPRLAAPTSIAYDRANILLTGINSTMQYRLESSTSWSSLSGTTLDLLSKASAEKDIKVLVRYKPTTANSASLPVEFIIPKLLDGPSCSIDYINEKIVGLDDNQAYQYFIGTNPKTTSSWISMKISNGSFDISGIAASTSKTINIRKAATTDEPITNYTTIILPARKTAPTTTVLEYNNADHYDKAVLTGITSDMEYRASTSALWTSIDSNNVVLDIPTSNTTYYIRYKSTSDDFASQSKSITLSKRATAPTSTYNSTTETITGLTTAMEISYNNSQYISVEATSINMSEIINELTEALTVNIRKSATSTAPASATKTFTLYPRLSSPTTVIYNKSNISLSGVSTKMQYRFEGSTSWTTFTGTAFNLLSYVSKDQDVKIFVRYSPTTVNAASLPLEFTIPKLLDGPICSIDYFNEKITGLDDNTAYQYFIGTNPKTTSSWISLKTTNGNFDISGIATSTSKTINIRKAATADEPITNYTTLILSARKAAPAAPAFVYNNINYYDKAVLTGVTSDMEYKASSDTSWTAIGNDDMVIDIPVANTTFYIRYKSTTDEFASQNRSVTLSKRATAPTSTYNTATETITGLTTAMEISYNSSEYVAVEATSINMSEVIDELTEALTVNIRKSATATLPASANKIITIYPRLTAPTAVIYNGASISLSGISNKMQYRFESSTSWTTFTGTTFSLLPYASKEHDIKIFVRYSPTTVNAASLPVEFTIPKLLDGPKCNIDYTNEMITGLDDNTSYQYFIGTSPTTTSKWLAMQTVNGNFDISSIVASTSKTINIRKAATADEPITNYTTLILAARKAAPTTPAFEYNNDNYYDKAVLTNVTSDMEYKLSTDLEWSELIGNELVVDVPDYGMTYYIRYKSTSESFSSSYRSLTLSNRKTAPNCIYDQSTQTITKLSNSMEIKIGEVGNYTPVTSTTYDLSDVLMSTNFVTVYIRYKATNTQPASYIQVIPCNCNADVVSDELDFVFNDTTVDNYDVVNPNEEFDNTSDDVTMENDNPLNPNDEFDEPFVEPIAEDCNITKSYVFNNDIVI